VVGARDLERSHLRRRARVGVAVLRGAALGRQLIQP
jgi:hypothetical protein